MNLTPTTSGQNQAFVAAEAQARGIPEGAARKLKVVNLLDFLTTNIKPREEILAPWLLTQSLSMIYAWRGIGKTHTALGIAYAVAAGGQFLRWKSATPRKVLYLDGEMPASSLQERINGLVKADPCAEQFDHDNFKLITPDLQDGVMPDLSTDWGQQLVDEALEPDTSLIVVDNLSTLVRSGGRENDAESWLGCAAWALRMRQQGRSVVFVHHSAKNGQQRGTSKREDILDVVITLKRPPDYDPESGAVFEVHFEKGRDLRGEDAKAFEAALTTDAAGISRWTFRDVEESNYDRVISLANDGLFQKDIAEELGINKSNVSRHWKKAVAAGLIRDRK